MTRRRLDAELVRRGLAATAAEARDAVGDGRVTVSGVTATKVATMVSGDVPVVVRERPAGYVSRAGAKLEAALDRFGIDPAGRGCLDAGASTGGFTDCLLQRGAARVVAVDVGYGQLHERLRADPRVTVLERTNARELRELPFPPELIVCDVSFISLRLALPPVLALARPGREAIVLVKPQFEAGRAEVRRG